MWNVGTSRITTPWLRRRSQFSNYRWDFDLRSSTRLVFIWEKCTTGWKLYKEGLINMEIFVSFHPLQIGQDKPFRNAPCKSKSHCSSYKQTTWMIIILPFPGVERSWRNCRRDWTASVLLWLQKKNFKLLTALFSGSRCWNSTLVSNRFSFFDSSPFTWKRKYGRFSLCKLLECQVQNMNRLKFYIINIFSKN